MDTPNDNDNKDEPKINLEKVISDYENPFKNDDFDNKDEKDEKEPKQNIFEIDPDKGNISEQIGMDLDFPTRTKIFTNMDEPQSFNNAKNLEINSNVPQATDEFISYKNVDNMGNNDNNERHFLDNFKDAINKIISLILQHLKKKKETPWPLF